MKIFSEGSSEDLLTFYDWPIGSTGRIGIVCLVVMVVGTNVDELVDGVSVDMLVCSVSCVIVVVVVDRATLLVDVDGVVLVGFTAEVVPS